MRRILTSVVAVALLAALAGTPVAVAATPTDSTALRNAVTVSGIMQHLNALEAIANANGGNREAGTPGGVQTEQYMIDRLTAAGYAVTTQLFDFPFFQEVSPPAFERISPDPVSYVEGTDFATMQFSGSGDITAPVQATNDVVIPPGPTASASNSGCEATDFTGFVPGNVALIQRGTCTFHDKATNAQNAGASAVILFNEGQPGRTDVVFGTLGDTDFTVPVIFATFAVGEDLYNRSQSGSVTVRVRTDTLSEIRQARNVIAETPGGRSDRVVVVGAHTDTTDAGPGITDDGSGVATDLEIAEQFAALGIQPVNKVRFAFWSAEEAGLIGSDFYVSQLSNRDIKNIAVNLAFDMLSSSNYVRFVYDGNGSSTPTAGPNGSGTVEQVFKKYFSQQGLATDPTELNGRTDYQPFMEVGIPVGGLFTGADGIKTAEQAVVYGGTAGEAYHPCYHLACDDVAHVNQTVLDQMSDAAAHAILTFAMTTSAVNGTDKGKAFGKTSEFLGPYVQR